MKITNWVLSILLLACSVQAATLTGTIYDLELNTLDSVLVVINTVPQQRYLADSDYSFDIPPGEYVLIAKKGDLYTKEDIKISGEGTFVFDLFLFPSLDDEDDILSGVDLVDLEDKPKSFAKYPLWAYLIALGIFLIAIGRIILAKKKYPRPGKKKASRIEEKKIVETTKLKKEKDKLVETEITEKIIEKEETTEPEEKETIEQSNDLPKALEIIKNHDGRISQKELRKEMLYLSEAKVSLILTELEHKGKIEKIKKGRGNVLILK